MLFFRTFDTHRVGGKMQSAHLLLQPVVATILSKMKTCNIILKLAKYAVPLYLVMILDDFGDIALNLSIARSNLNSSDVQDAIHGLAAFGASHRLVRFAWGPAKATRSVGVRMVENTTDYIRALCFVLITAIPFFLFMILASITKFGGIISGIEAESRTGTYLSQSLFYMSFLPFFKAFCRLHEGLLLSFQLSHIVSFAAVVTLLGQVVAIFVLLKIPNLPTKMIVPPLALYFGFFCKILVLMYGTYFHAWNKLKMHALNTVENGEELDEGKQGDDDDDARSNSNNNNDNSNKNGNNFCDQFTVLFKFWLPLGTTMLFQTISRPFINFLVATSKNGEIGLAVLTLCFPVGHLHYSWVVSLFSNIYTRACAHIHTQNMKCCIIKRALLYN
jgi:hypothetical protein